MNIKSSRRRSDRLSSAGFTLLEVMIVMTIIAAVITLVIPRIGNQNNQIKATVRRFSMLSRQLHSLAKLNNATYRLVIDLKDGDAQAEYWVEKSTKNVLLDKEVFISEAGSSQDEEDEKKQSSSDGFERDDKVLKSVGELPGDLQIGDVELVIMDRPLTTGRVYIHYYPQGRVDEAVIHLNIGEKLNWTVAIHPLTGRAEIASRYVSLKDIRSQ